MGSRASERICLLALASSLNCCLAGIEGHAPWVDVAVSAGLGLATSELTRAGAGRTVHAALVAIGGRWIVSLLLLAHQHERLAGTARLAIGGQLLGFVVLASDSAHRSHRIATMAAANVLLQTVLGDVHQTTLAECTPTCHAWGEQFPGIDRREWTQMTLHEAWRAPTRTPSPRRLPASAVVAEKATKATTPPKAVRLSRRQQLRDAVA